MIHFLRKHILGAALLAAALLGTAPAANADKAIPLITKASQLQAGLCDPVEGVGGHGLQTLIDGDPKTYWSSQFTTSTSGLAHTIDIFMNESLTESTDMAVRIQRPAYDALNESMARREIIQFNVWYCVEGSNAWIWYGSIMMQHFSSHSDFGDIVTSPMFTLPGSVENPIYKVVLQSNLTKAKSDDFDNPFALAELQLFKITHDDDAPASEWFDKLVGARDFNLSRQGLALQHTQGVVDSHNHQIDALKNWVEDWDAIAAGEWPRKELLEEYKVTVPEFAFMTSADDPRIAPGQKRSHAHTLEHDVYVLPGEPVNLSPYSAFAINANAYHSRFYRWYDWTNDGAHSHVYFPTAPNSTFRSQAVGDFGGSYVWNNFYERQMAEPIFYAPDSRKLDDTYIAFDLSQEFDWGHNVDNASNTLYEPTVAFRHIFHLTDATEFAKTFSADVAANRKYVAENKRILMGRAGAEFQFRLEKPIPRDVDTPSEYYYIAQDGSTQHVYRSIMETTDPNGNVTVAGDGLNQHAPIFHAHGEYAGRGSIWADTDGNWHILGDLGKTYYRFMRCLADNAKAGTYTVRLIACDREGKRIKVRNSDEDLIVAEFEITFLSEEMASMHSDEQLATPAYEKFRPEYIEQSLGLGEPTAVVDFDKFRYMRTDASNNYINNVGAHTYYKWPIAWNQTAYGFGFNERHDYNMYMLADHSDVTPYHAAVDNFPQESNFGHGRGLFDRLFYDTKGQDKGYFYYVNASGDPGTIATINIDNLCSGSTLYVSAWMAEFSAAAERANIIVKFVANLHDGSTVTLNRFVSGYVPAPFSASGGNAQRWYHLYYQFNPDFQKLGLSSNEIKSYSLVLDNNCINSGGADYAVDDIRVYVAKPRVYARQTVPMCADSRSAIVKIETPFDVIMKTMGHNPDDVSHATDVNFYYSFLRKDVYDKIMAESNDYEKAFNAALLRYRYNTSLDNNDQTYGHLTFKTNYESNPLFDPATEWTTVQNNAWRQVIQGEEYLTFNTMPTDVDLKVGQEYYLVLCADDGEVIVPDAYSYDMEGECAKKCSFTITSSGVVKIDGVAVPDMSGIEVCENQSPTVQIDIRGMNDNTTPGSAPDMEVLEKNAVMDWYEGSMEQYMNEQYTDKDGNSIFLYDAIANFRAVEQYQESDDVTLPAVSHYTELSRECLMHYTTEVNGRPRLFVYQASYVFPSLKMEEGETTDIYVTAIPIDRYSASTNTRVCTEPSEIKLTVTSKSPYLLHGINNTQMGYPDWMTDVPLRIGLRQLKSVSGDMDTHPYMLNIPLRYTEAVTAGVVALLQKTDDDFIYLVETNDPEYKDLSVPVDDPSGLLAVGRLRELIAVVIGDKTANMARIAFDGDFRFREGYYYRMRFNYQEDRYNSSQSICDGQDVFTIKVVPEFQKWTGSADGSVNFNNDANWSRVTSAEILRANDDTDEYTIDPVVPTPADSKRPNNNPVSYAPMNFTKVLVPAGATYPHTPEVASTDINVYTEGAFRLCKWNNEAGDASDAGAATADIIYDMAADYHTDGHSVGCFPWLANNCDQIHFMPGGMMFAQQNLVYNKAWVDVRTAPEKWYTLASPLQSVVAGDMYLPTDGARQLTPLFEDITFDESLNHRFKPAVYQRSWNTAKATVYELPGNGTTRNVALRTTWSNVFNDVTESYTPGRGFSIKTDVSALGAGAPDSVLFRLPKADTAYYYFTQDYDGGSGVKGDHTAIARDNAARLNPVSGTITVKGAAPGKYFMVGNPFMAHLDMKLFLKANRGVVTGKFYVMNGDGTLDAMVDEASDYTQMVSVGTLDTDGLIAPLQSFFVEARNEATEISLSYDASMMAVAPHAPYESPLRSRSAADAPAGLTVTATADDGTLLSQAMLRTDAGASAAFSDTEDMALLADALNPAAARVYTVAGNTAVTVNTLDRVDRVEVGMLAADADARTTLTFDGTDAAGAGLMLYDALTDTATPLYDGLAVEVTGDVAHRLFITAGDAETELISTIAVEVEGNKVTVRAHYGDDTLEAAAYDTMGRRVCDASDDSGTVTFTLERGVYVVTARCGRQSHTAKIVIR